MGLPEKGIPWRIVIYFVPGTAAVSGSGGSSDSPYAIYRYFDCGTGWPGGSRKVCDSDFMYGRVGGCDIDKENEIRRPLWYPMIHCFLLRTS